MSRVHKELEMAVKTSAMRVNWRIGKSRREMTPGIFREGMGEAGKVQPGAFDA